MRECLDEAMLQSYFDGELSTQAMERATLHLASCIPCAAAARELEQETSLLEEALAPEFEAAVPTERLRHRIDAAVSGLHVVRPVAQPSRVAGFFSSLGSLFTLTPQRAVGYASLVAVLAFAVIFGVIKMRTPNNTVAVSSPGTPTAPQASNQKTSATESVASVNNSDQKQIVPVSTNESSAAKTSSVQRPRI